MSTGVSLVELLSANGGRGGMVYSVVCLCVCLFLLTDISKTDTARITKLDIQMFNDDSRKPLYLGVKCQR